MIYDLHVVFSSFFMAAPLEMVALAALQIYFMVYLMDITNIDKICDSDGQKLKYLCKLIGVKHMMAQSKL